MLDNIRIVLINTFHPGNVGAAARAMKNMGLTDLWLVEPNDYPNEEAVSRAAGAKDLLDNATIVSSLEEAISDCQLVIGTSARNRTFNLPQLDARACAAKATTESHQGNVAIVFGRETMGLHNSELQQCNYHVFIPSNPEYPVMNISQAVQVMCYELWMESNRDDTQYPQQEYPLHKDMGLFYDHLERVLNRTKFIIPQHQGKVLEKLHRYFNRSRPEKTELNMLRGILTSVEETLDNEKS